MLNEYTDFEKRLHITEYHYHLICVHKTVGSAIFIGCHFQLSWINSFHATDVFSILVQYMSTPHTYDGVQDAKDQRNCLDAVRSQSTFLALCRFTPIFLLKFKVRWRKSCSSDGLLVEIVLKLFFIYNKVKLPLSCHIYCSVAMTSSAREKKKTHLKFIIKYYFAHPVD